MEVPLAPPGPLGSLQPRVVNVAWAYKKGIVKGEESDLEMSKLMPTLRKMVV